MGAVGMGIDHVLGVDESDWSPMRLAWGSLPSQKDALTLLLGPLYR